MPGSTAPRIVALSSEAHRAAPSNVKFESLEEINNDKLGPTELYGRTKLALILFMKYGLVEKIIKPDSDNSLLSEMNLDSPYFRCRQDF